MTKKKTIEAPDPTAAATPSKPLAKRLAARSGLGAGLISQRLAAHNDDAAIETLLAGGYIPEILALLEPKNKA